LSSASGTENCRAENEPGARGTNENVLKIPTTEQVAPKLKCLRERLADADSRRDRQK
jgi:hypothetical protein